MNPERERRLAAKVAQLLPADGWLAVYASVSGKPHTDRLVCWALISTPDRNDEGHEYGEVLPWSQQAVVGLVADSDGNITPACTSANFLAYAAPSDDLSLFDEQAKELGERLREQGWKP